MQVGKGVWFPPRNNIAITKVCDDNDGDDNDDDDNDGDDYDGDDNDDDDNDDCDDDDHDNFCAQRIILNETLPQAKSPCMSVAQIC